MALLNKKKKSFIGVPAPLGYVPGLGRGWVRDCGCKCDLILYLVIDGESIFACFDPQNRCRCKLLRTLWKRELSGKGIVPFAGFLKTNNGNLALWTLLEWVRTFVMRMQASSDSNSIHDRGLFDRELLAGVWGNLSKSWCLQLSKGTFNLCCSLCNGNTVYLPTLTP